MLTKHESKPVDDLDFRSINNPNSACLADFEIKTILGQGSNGTVYKAYQTYTNPATGQKNLHRVVALKEVKMKESISRKAYQNVINEVNVMAKISHPNIIQMYDSFLDKQYDTSALKKLLDKSAKNGTESAMSVNTAANGQ